MEFAIFLGEFSGAAVLDAGCDAVHTEGRGVDQAAWKATMGPVGPGSGVRTRWTRAREQD